MAHRRRSSYDGSVAFDAAGSSGLAFLNSMLGKVSTEITKPLAAVTHDRDVYIETGGGFPDYLVSYATDFGTTGGNQYGLQGTDNTDTPLIQATLNQGVWKAYIWQAGMLVTYLQLKKLEFAMANGLPAPFNFQDILEDGVQLTWNKALDYVTYLGFLGDPGLVNNGAVTAALAAATGTGSSTLWVNKTPNQIQADINAAIITPLQASGYSNEGYPDTMLIPFENFNYIQQPMNIGAYGSILEYVTRNNTAKANGIDFKILPLPDPWIAGQGTGGTNRAVVYRNDRKCVKLQVPQPIQKVMTVPSTDKGGSYSSLFNGCIGQLQWLRPQTAFYLDGI